jgi:hypothetical protein
VGTPGADGEGEGEPLDDVDEGSVVAPPQAASAAHARAIESEVTVFMTGA